MVLGVPFALRYLFATDPAAMGQALGIVTRAIASHLIKSALWPGERLRLRVVRRKDPVVTREVDATRRHQHQPGQPGHEVQIGSVPLVCLDACTQPSIIRHRL